MFTRFLALTVLFLAALPADDSRSADSNGVTEYTAIYDIEVQGRSGEARFSVAAEDDEYVFDSSITVKGLLVWAVRPNPAVERSRFVVADGEIQPLRFKYEDGSRKGESSFLLDFEPSENRIRVTGPDVSRSLPFEKGLLDRGSLQVALMRDLAACKLPGPYRYVEDDGVTTYHYERLDDLPTETGIGTVATVRFAQQHASSSRSTVLWLAPAYDYLPVRIERFKDGELEWNFALDKLDGIEPSASACLGFR